MRVLVNVIYVAAAFATAAAYGQTVSNSTANMCSSVAPRQSEKECWQAAFITSDEELTRQFGATQSRYVDRAQVPSKERRDALVLSLKEFRETFSSWYKSSATTCKDIVGTASEQDDPTVAVLRCRVVMNQSKILEMKSLPLVQ